MERQQFDELARRFATGASRRQLLKVMIGGAIGITFCPAVHSAKAEDATPIASCTADDECGEGGICCGEICLQTECCSNDSEDTHCGAELICTDGICHGAPQCSLDTDCDPCNACMSGVCTWQCGMTCGSTCDTSSGEHGTCRFDCRAGEGDACCDSDHMCDRKTGACESKQEQPGSLVILSVNDQGNPLPGACFDLLDVQSGEVITSQPHCDGAFGDFGPKDGAVVFANDVRGRFLVRETIAPDGYTPGPDQTTPIIGSGETVTITFVNTPISVPSTVTPSPETTPVTPGTDAPNASGGNVAAPSVALPNTGAKVEDDSRGSWVMTGAALIGGTAALLGGKKIRKTSAPPEES
jgi:hypothetical protein